MVDNVEYAQRLVDSILRNNPLVNAVVPSGLMKWYGNYQNPDTSPVNFLWIGEFLPSDPNMGGRPQKGFSLVRDDPSRSSAIAMFDRSPGTPLVQTISIGSWDGQPLIDESRNQGGQSFPRQQVPLGRADGSYTNYPYTSSTSISTLMEGRFSGNGNTLHYRLWGITPAGVAGQVRLRLVDGATVVTSPWNAIPANGNQIFDSTMDVSAFRGHKDAIIYLEGQVTSGAGNVYCSPIVISVYST
jgi:hypothetical protein